MKTSTRLNSFRRMLWRMPSSWGAMNNNSVRLSRICSPHSKTPMPIHNPSPYSSQHHPHQTLLPGLMIWGKIICVLVIIFSETAQSADIVGSGAILQGLDKVTARITTLRAPNHLPVRFGTLEIVIRACRKRPPEETPESAAYLEIHDKKPGEPPEQIFQGWMFASSPALSALEHSVYDIWVLDCDTGAIPNRDNTSSSAIIRGKTAE